MHARTGALGRWLLGDGSSPGQDVPRRVQGSSAAVALTRLKQDLRDGTARAEYPSVTEAPISFPTTQKPEDSNVNMIVTADQEEKEVPTESVLSPKFIIRNAEISSEEDLTIHGQWLDGKLRVRRLVVAQGATVTGDIVAVEIKNYGSLSGNVKTESLFLYKGSTLLGDATCQSVGIQVGSTVRARIDADATQVVSEDARAPNLLLGTASSTFDGEFPNPQNVHVLAASGMR